MSVETKWYLIEFYPFGSSKPEYFDVMAEDAPEAVDTFRKEVVGADINNVFLQLNGSWNRSDDE